jgi:hypothetical protein
VDELAGEAKGKASQFEEKTKSKAHEVSDKI